MSLRSKRVPQVLQILAYLLHLPFIFCWSEGNNCASEATQILRLNNEQNLRYLNILAHKK